MKFSTCLRLAAILLLSLAATVSKAQSTRLLSAALGVHWNQTLYDQHVSGNSSGVGLSARTFVRITQQLHGIAEVNIDLYQGTKELVLDADGHPLPSKGGLTLMGGGSYRLANWVSTSFTAGLAFYDDQINFAIRPAATVYPGSSGRVGIHLSFTNVAQNNPGFPQDFGYLSAGILMRLF